MSNHTSDTSDTPVRQCSICQQWYPETPEFFNRNCKSPNGLMSRCKSCKNALVRGDLVLIDFRSILSKQGKKRCSNGNSCVHPEGSVLPATTEYFYSMPRMPGGLQSQCIACLSEYHKQYRKAHQIELQHKSKVWLDKNPHKRREYARRWREKNPERASAIAKKTELKCYERRRVWMHNRRAHKRSLPNNFTAADWRRALDYFQGCCAVCGRPFHDLFGVRTLSADHWIPISSSSCPGTVVSNMIPLCHGLDGCNNSKHDKDPIVWLTERYSKRRAKEILKRIEDYFEWVKSTSKQAS